MTERVFAIAAHPDDIEFLMAGTLILMRRAGCEVHYMCIANGSCGTAELGREDIVRIRRAEERSRDDAPRRRVRRRSLAASPESFFARGQKSPRHQ